MIFLRPGITEMTLQDFRTEGTECLVHFRHQMIVRPIMSGQRFPYRAVHRSCWYIDCMHLVGFNRKRFIFETHAGMQIPRSIRRYDQQAAGQDLPHLPCRMVVVRTFVPVPHINSMNQGYAQSATETGGVDTEHVFLAECIPKWFERVTGVYDIFPGHFGSLLSVIVYKKLWRKL